MGQTQTRGKAEPEEIEEKLTPAGNPLPTVLHAVLSREKIGTGRIIMVGDVHGCCDELRQLLKQCQFDQAADTLIFNGDMINKGPKSVEVLDYIRSLGALAVRGNQDDKALAEWLKWKSGAPLKSHPWLEELSEDNARWLSQLPFSLSIPCRNVLVVHAGMVSGVPLQDQTLDVLTELRTLAKPQNAEQPSAEEPAVASGEARVEGSDRGSGNAAPQTPSASEEVPWASLWTGPQHVFFGHDAKRRLQTWPAATGLDTGCCYGGLLTACILPPAKETGSKTTGNENPERRPAEFSTAVKSKEPPAAMEQTAPTLAQLGGSLVMVPARRVYHVKHAKGSTSVP